MAGITGIGGIDVIRSFARSDYTVMTTNAGAKHLTVVNIGVGYRNPCRRSWLMTGIACIGGTDMAWTFARRNRAIMATDTGTYHLRMIYVRGSDWNPDRRTDMTRFTNVT